MSIQKSRSGLSFDQLDRLRLISKSGSVRKSYTEPNANGLTGLQMYDLRGPASRMIPVVSILRNLIPRKAAPRGTTGLHWKAITGVNVGNILPGVSEGNRNAPIAQTTADYSQGFAGLGMENFNTFEAGYAMEGYADVEALSRLDALESLMNAEERVILGGNASVAFGTAPTPAGVIVTAGGALTAQIWLCRVVALTFEGMLLASVAGGVSTNFNRTNADASVDNVKGGSSMISAASAGVTSAGVNSILWKWTSVPGAAGYAIYLGTVAATCTIAAIVTTNEYLQTTNPSGGTQQASAITADNSINDLVFDGVITQLCKSGSGAIVKTNNGDPLTVNSAGTVDQLDTIFAQMFEASRTGPTFLLINAMSRAALTKNVMAAGGGTPAIQVNISMGAGEIRTGATIASILNPYTGQFVPFVTHPFMPKGMIVGWSSSLPYPVQNLRGNYWMETRQEYYSIQWPLRTRKSEFGVYVDEGLIIMIPFAFFVLQDVET